MCLPFDLGQCFITKEAADNVPEIALFSALARHANADWGLVDQDQAIRNEEYMLFGIGAAVSAYNDLESLPLRIVTTSLPVKTLIFLAAH